MATDYLFDFATIENILSTADQIKLRSRKKSADKATGLIDYGQHSVKQMKMLKYSMAGLIAHLLSSEAFIHKVFYSLLVVLVANITDRFET